MLLSLLIVYQTPSSQADTTYGISVPWNCPPYLQDPTTGRLLTDPVTGDYIPDLSAPPSTEDKDKDGKVDRLYFHIIDSLGRDVQLWCVDHGLGGDYYYYASFPGMNDTYLSKCDLARGINEISLVFSGNAQFTNVTKTSTVTKNYTVSEPLKIYNHTNWVPHNAGGSDAGKDIHTVFNYTSSAFEKERIATKINQSTGEHEIAYVEKMFLPPFETPNDRLVSEEQAFVFNAFPDMEDKLESDDSSCIIGDTPKIHQLQMSEITHNEIPHMIYYSSGTDIDSISLTSNGILLLEYSTIPHNKFVNIAIPHDLMNSDDGYHVIVDEVDEIIASETSSSTHSVLTFSVPSTTASIMIDKSLIKISTGDDDYAWIIIFISAIIIGIIIVLTIKKQK